jgi:hypothetical protein
MADRQESAAGRTIGPRTATWALSSKFYTGLWRRSARHNDTVFAHESPTRFVRFEARKALYSFALTMPVSALDHLEVRKRFEQRFAVERMAGDYLALYRQLADVADGRRVRACRTAGWRTCSSCLGLERVESQHAVSERFRSVDVRRGDGIQKHCKVGPGSG